MRSRVKRLPGALAVALMALCGEGSAQDWPTRPVTMVVPFAAGGPVDTAARLITPLLSDILGQQVIVENLGGAGGMTGSNRVAKAPPDGYLFLFGNQGTHTFSQLLYKKPLYNAETDFAPVGLVLENTKVLALRKDLPVSNVAEFIAYARTHQDRMQFGSAGGGSATHIACVLLNVAIGVNITHVPYRGSGPALQDLVAGRIDYTCEVISTALPQIEARAIKPIAMLATARSAVLPQVPTALEQGLAGVDANGWNAFFFPKDTPEPIVRKLAAATHQALDAAWLRERMEGLGLTVPAPERRGPQPLARLVTAELAKWTPPVKASGASND